MEKICYNKLQKLAQEYIDLAEPRRAGLLCAMEFLQELQGKKTQTIALQHYTQYLNNIKATKHINYDDVIYFGAMEKARQARCQIHSDELYDLVYEYPPITETEISEYWKEAPTPPEYIW